MTPNDLINYTKKKFVESSLFSGLLISSLALLIGWGIWVTTTIFSHTSILDRGKEIRMLMDQSQWNRIEANTLEIKDLRATNAQNYLLILSRLNEIELCLARMGEKVKREKF